MRALPGRRVREGFARGVVPELSPKGFDWGTREKKKVCYNLNLLPSDDGSGAGCVEMCLALWAQMEAPGYLRAMAGAPDHRVWLGDICTALFARCHG